MLTVEILDMKVEGLGFSSLWPGIGIFPDWVRRKEFGIKTQVVEVKDGIVHWNDVNGGAILERPAERVSLTDVTGDLPAAVPRVSVIQAGSWSGTACWR
jgi:hypothetical protein